MIPSIFARVVEEDASALGFCVDYLEDHGIDVSILRFIADNHFLLDDSGYCSRSSYRRGAGCNYGYISDGSGNGSGYGIFLATVMALVNAATDLVVAIMVTDMEIILVMVIVIVIKL